MLPSYDTAAIVDFVDNTSCLSSTPYAQQEILSIEAYRGVKEEITSWDNYHPTLLHTLEEFARNCGVQQVYYKDEGERFGLKSFKALGGAYAVMKHLCQVLRDRSIEASSHDLRQKIYDECVKEITVCCATDGNHGRSVAWGAFLFGCRCIVYLHEHVSANREDAIKAWGAEVIRVKGNYDDSVKVAADEAKKYGYTVISDTSYEGYTAIPKDIMQGYTLVIDEAVSQMQSLPTHVFLQGGVGGFAASVVAYLYELYPAQMPTIVVVEPSQAACLLESAKQGALVCVEGTLETIMAGLACGEVSTLAWEILHDKVSYFMSITDDMIVSTMQYLAKKGIVAGESGVAGLAGFLHVNHHHTLKEQLGLNEQARILCIGTEGDSDPVLYQNYIKS